ncbi:hypothetical protein DLM45_13620 [Hyphomicrobium methylovorum]|uniref:PAS domain-containing protein n=1 Tax=Hyphomicrobium methylovorum TaxID=84 RepID=UPI0015E68D4B|nr:PAS domain-containing protein [Hyphomicrobium methylovorum]MBA2127254.1 hypothetical protein [Hyphomicrobium methylovorum]
MREFHTDPSARSSINVGRRWLKAQRALDWPSTGLPELDDWDQAIAIVARLVACSSAPMALMIGSNGILFANEAAERRLFTETTEAINGRSVFDVLPRNAAFFKSVLTQAQTGKSLSFREQALCPTSGDLKSASWFNLDFIPVTDTDGNIAGVLGMANDITPFVNRIDSLSDSEQRLRHALDGSGMVGIWTLDVATGISTADANVARIYGLAEKTCEEGINDSLFFKAIHPDDRERVRTSLAEAIASGTPYRSRYRIIDKNKNVRWVIVSAKPIQNDNGGIARPAGRSRRSD